MRSSRAKQWTGVLVAMASCLALAACSTQVEGHGRLSLGAGASSPTAGMPTAGASSATSTPTTSSGSPSALGDLLVPRPAGSRDWDNAWSANVTPTVQEFCAHEYAPSYVTAEVAQLQAQGLAGIVHRTWIATDADQADVVLLRFATVAGAESRYLFATKSKGLAPGEQTFTIPGGRQAAGYYQPTLDDDGYVRGVVYAQSGDVVLELFYFSPASFKSADVLAWSALQLAKIG